MMMLFDNRMILLGMWVIGLHNIPSPTLADTPDIPLNDTAMVLHRWPGGRWLYVMARAGSKVLRLLFFLCPAGYIDTHEPPGPPLCSTYEPTHFPTTKTKRIP